MEGDQVYVTKAMLLEGSAWTEDVETDQGLFRVRPLTGGEKAKIAALRVKGFKGQGKGANPDNMDYNMDMEAAVTNEWEATFYILSFGLSVKGGEVWSLRDVKAANFERETKAKLVSAIKRISGMEVTVKEALANFRPDEGREPPSPTDSSGRNETRE